MELLRIHPIFRGEVCEPRAFFEDGFFQAEVPHKLRRNRANMSAEAGLVMCHVN